MFCALVAALGIGSQGNTSNMKLTALLVVFHCERAPGDLASHVSQWVACARVRHETVANPLVLEAIYPEGIPL